MGTLSKNLLKAYEVILEIRDEMENIAKPGVPCSHLYHLSSQIVRKRGLEDYFIGTKKIRLPL